MLNQFHIPPNKYSNFKKTYRIQRLRNIQCTINDLIDLGYLDVNRTLHKISDNQRKHIKKCVCNFLTTIINCKFLNQKYCKCLNQKYFDNLHDNCCNNIINYNNGVQINYGQAQKVINLSCKYLYNEFAFWFFNNQNYIINYPNGIEFYFHCPIDNQILKSLDCYNNDINAWHRPTKKPWSQWDRNSYKIFQKNLRNHLINNCVPLEVDFILWNPSGIQFNQIHNNLSGIIKP